MHRSRPEVRYETASGASFSFAGASSLYAPAAHGWERSADGRSVGSPAREIKGQLAFAAGSSREAADRMLALAWADMDSGTPGALIVGEWSMRCYMLKLEPSIVTSGNALYDVTLYAREPIWTRETLFRLPAGSGTEVSAETVDCPYDFPHDYGSKSAAGTTIRVPGPLPCDLRITFYGYAMSPYVRVGSNVYQVNVTVPSGGYLTIDPLRKSSMAGDSVVLCGPYGDKTDVFPKRLQGHEGSGTYIYEKVKPGEQLVTWPQSVGVDLAVIERRGCLPWTSC